MCLRVSSYLIGSIFELLIVPGNEEEFGEALLGQLECHSPPYAIRGPSDDHPFAKRGKSSSS